MKNPRPSQVNQDIDSTGKNSYVWIFKGTFEVSDVWIADGFNLTPERLQRILESALETELGWANCETELKTTSQVLTAPNPDSIRKEQGYDVAVVKNDAQYVSIRTQKVSA